MRAKLHIDGGVRTGGVNGPTKGRSGPASIGFVIHDETGRILRKGGAHIGEATVNEAEYSALIAGLYNCHSLGIEEVDVYSDSQLLVYQMKGKYAIRKPHLQVFAAEAKEEEKHFEKVSYTWVPREQNKLADAITEDFLGKR